MDNHKLKFSGQTYEVTFCIGSREGYNGRSFTRDDLIEQISKFQTDFKESMPVKVSDTVTFVMRDYREDGWEVSAITYPNSPKISDEIDCFMHELAKHLFYHFRQNRITIRHLFSPNTDNICQTMMIESLDAEKSHHEKK